MQEIRKYKSRRIILDSFSSKIYEAIDFHIKFYQKRQKLVIGVKIKNTNSGKSYWDEQRLKLHRVYTKDIGFQKEVERLEKAIQIYELTK